MELSKVTGNQGAPRRRLEHARCPPRRRIRLMLLVTLALSTAQIEARASVARVYANALTAHSIPLASALNRQTISFTALSGKTFGAAPFAITASASSGLPVSFASLTIPVCTVTNGTVTIVSGGICTIQATQSGNATFAAAPFVNQYFIVASASQTIAFGPLGNQTMGATGVSVNAISSSGLPVSFTSITPAVCTITASSLTTVFVGTCTIRASQGGNTNYLPAPYVDQGFQITAAAPVASWLLFAPMPTYGVANSARAFAVADFNRDGRPDVAVVNSSYSTVSMLLGDGRGGFAAGQFLPTGIVPNDIVAADFNGDGKVDLAVTNMLDNSAWIYLGNGDGTFQHQIVVNLGAPPHSVAAADLNRDGKVDLVVTNSLGGTTWNTLQVLLGKGDGTFQPPVSYLAGTDPSGVAVGDINGDGALDLIVGNFTSNDFFTLLGNGDGTFRPALTVPLGQLRMPAAVVIGDFNGDGKPDVAIANKGLNPATVAIFLGRGDGTYASAGTLKVGATSDGLAVADLNGDGQLDLVVTNSFDGKLYVFPGVGDGSFQPPQILSLSAGFVPLALGDFNGDGRTDLLVGNASIAGVTVLLNQTSMPSAINPLAGTPQSAPAGAAYPIALSADVRDEGNNALSGRSVTLVAPASGPSGTFTGGAQGTHAVTNVNGVATAPTFTANATTGSFSVLAAVGALTTSFGLTNGTGAARAPAFTNGPPSNGFLGSPYSFTLTATGIPPPIFSVTGAALPPGLALGPASGLINGTPTTTGAFAGTFKAANGTTPDATQSFTITILGNAQAVTFAPPANRVFGDAPFIVSASTSSGLPVSFSSLTMPVCSVSGNTVTILGIGTCTVQASQPGNATYAAAPNVTQAFTVVQGSQSITFGALANLPLGSPPFAANATASSGLPTGLTSQTVSVCTISGNTVTLLASGTCTIRASQSGNANYAPAAIVDQTFSVMGASGQTIAFGALSSKPLSSPAFVVSAVASSGLPVVFSSLTPTVCTVSAGVVTLAAMGTCTIRASQAGNGIYSAAPSVDQGFTVAQRSQTIAFLIFAPPVTSLAASDTLHDLYAKASSGLPVSFTSLTPAVCRLDVNLLLLLRVGNCTVRASQPGDGNYSAAQDVDQSFPVTAAYQWLSFWRPEDRLITMSPIQLSATSASGIPVSFSSRTPEVCTVSGSVATLVGSYSGSATCTIDATVAGTADFLPAIASRSFRVSGRLDFFVPPAPFAGPLVEYSAYLGSSSYDTAFDVVVGPEGSAYVGGSVAATNFLGLGSATFTNGGLDLLYVTKIGADHATLNFATVVGGRAPDITNSGRSAYVGALQPSPGSLLGGGQVEAMSKDSVGNVYVAAYANSTQFPVSSGTYSRTGEKYIFKVAPNGAVQRVSAAIDPAVSTIRALAIDSNGSIYFTGVAKPDLITGSNAVIPSVPAGTVVAPYLIKLGPGGATTVFATYLSIHGSRPGTRRPANVFGFSIDSETTAYALAVDASGNSYLAGQANADDFPVTAGAAQGGGYDTQFRDAFVAKVNPTGSSFVFVARLDGGRSDEERATSIALSPDGGIVIGGKSSAEPFYGSGTAFQDQVGLPPHADTDREIGFIAKLVADGSHWQFVAPIGAYPGNLLAEKFSAYGDPAPVKVAVDANGAIYAAGTARSADSLPVRSNIPGINAAGGFNYAFIMKLSPDGSRQIYSTVLGAGIATGLAVDSFGNAYVAGYKGGLPLINGQVIPSGDSNMSSVFIAKINDQVMPLILATDHNPETSGQPVNLVARLGDSRYSGSIEFRNGSQVVATVATSAGSATLPLTLATGIYRLSAVFHGSGPFDGIVAPELVQVINQAAP